MSVSIETQHGPHHVYFPGQILRGIITYTVHKQRKIHHANLCFRGKVETEHVEGRRGPAGNTHGPRKRAEEILRLFEYNETLFKGPFDVPPQIFRWPFEFVIPTHVDCRRRGNTSPGFVEDGLAPLPPSFTSQVSTFSYDAQARIKYKLAMVVDSGGIFSDDKLELPVVISRLAHQLPPEIRLRQQEFLPSQTWSSRELRQEGHNNIKQRLKHVFSDDPNLKTPCISFRAYVHFPTTLSSSQQFPVGFSIKHFRVTPNDPEAPTLILDSLHLKLKSHDKMTTVYHGMSLTGDRFSEGFNFLADHDVRFQACELPLNGTVVDVAADLKLVDWVDGDVFRLTGDFATYTVKHGHSMRVHATVRHQQTNHQFQMKTEFPLQIRSPHQSELGIEMFDGPQTARGSRPADGDRLDEEPLPRYEDDVQPPAAAQVAEIKR